MCRKQIKQLHNMFTSVKLIFLNRIHCIVLKSAANSENVRSFFENMKPIHRTGTLFAFL